jgi:hypothetical protein
MNVQLAGLAAVFGYSVVEAKRVQDRTLMALIRRHARSKIRACQTVRWRGCYARMALAVALNGLGKTELLCDKWREKSGERQPGVGVQLTPHLLLHSLHRHLNEFQLQGGCFVRETISDIFMGLH